MNTSSTLVVLPGLDGTDVFFRPFLAALPPSIRPLVIVYPHVGSDAYQELLGMVRRVIADVPEFYVLGSSFSGPLAIMLAAAEPAKVRGIILSATFLRSPQRNLARLKFAATTPVIWTLRAVRRIPVWLRKPNDPFRRAKAETWSRVSAKSLATRLRAVMAVDVREIFRSCTQPVLCMTFEQDRTVPRDCAEEILRLCPSATLASCPGGHFAMYTDPQRFAATVARFMQNGKSA